MTASRVARVTAISVANSGAAVGTLLKNREMAFSASNAMPNRPQLGKSS